MKKCLLAVGAVNVTPLCFRENRKILRFLLAEFSALKSEVKVLCLPDLVLSGVGCQDRFLSASLERGALAELAYLLPHTRGFLTVFGMPLRFHDHLYKASVVVADGRILGVHFARNIPFDGLHYDKRWFTPWTGPVPARGKILDTDVPFGMDSFEWNGLRFGFVEDIEESRSGNGIDILLYPAAIPFELGNQARIRTSLERISRERKAVVLFANLLGNESGPLIYDGGSTIAAHGELIRQAARFSYRETTLTAMEFQPEKTPVSDRLPNWELSEQVKYEELARAVPLGMFDYMRKSRSNGFTLSLSGGADSASLAVFIRLMVHFGQHCPEFWDKVEYMPDLVLLERYQERTEEDIVARILTTAYQATAQSSKTTREAANEVARFVGSKHYEFEIESIVKAYRSMVEQAVGRVLTWQHDDLALQNIQARTRAPGIWLLANLNGSLLLSTGNRSEAACGYATMDGDTCGGLSPIVGIDKAFLRRWLVWMEKTGPETFGPVPVLKYINDQQPTAELRPSEQHQTDEGDLMPYPILEFFEEAAIRDRLSALESIAYVREQAQANHLSVTEDELQAWYMKFCRRWQVSQWKRQRGAPGFHLDDHNLSGDSWCRYPILSGGFEFEIDELHNEQDKE